ncbi:polysaccharide pyruvyl transferase family protein [Cupriavidus taiwanensis]|uniref:Putative Polysaccharide pyruvyl transferase n=1 Tax=Cupriavidus taiwanensis TaxID=164546 RepID=A0A375GV17_9BURK|nr:polysaccharide pyruvyl transferase family protein [Cupriavidus taiwanensis]SOY42662.1 putative Polysaccharide pyruvyl transferase [Cupriavidus taiwanensis]SOY44790.1 putative Polysaccharide pyruvyl transferase [Cupriavidus taiwanensis]SOY80671.1 putative Polysaccharide pyruvyl transferase [Cupriavidus taiwanensis]SOZ21574.1 putative Polysaccharide pyruvyl transferase [Cupriavidus taiwanensis]SOZ52409.1 putative Polysaccharide pyruvyl transferase [Cupriavidus taiwanensis]
MKHVVICAVPYSDNLGDAVIAETLGHLIRQAMPDCRVSFLDIAGRTRLGEHSLKKGHLMRLFSRLPGWARVPVLSTAIWLKYRRQWRARWQQQLADADMVVVGGGQLLCDVDLNFPLKLYLLARCLGQDAKVALVSVGVAAGWSRLGRYLVSRFFALAAPQFVSVRDESSRRNIVGLGAGEPCDVAIIPDPAILSSALYAEHGLEKRWDVGICVSDVESLHYNADLAALSAQSEQGAGLGMFVELVRKLRQGGQRVVLFTNGAEEDNLAAATVRSRLGAEVADGVDYMLPASPAALASIIAGCHSMVGHRMHANIIAFSFGVPSVGIVWDTKVASFFKLSGRGDFAVRQNASANDVMERLAYARALGAAQFKRSARLGRDIRQGLALVFEQKLAVPAASAPLQAAPSLGGTP